MLLQHAVQISWLRVNDRSTGDKHFPSPYGLRSKHSRRNVSFPHFGRATIGAKAKKKTIIFAGPKCGNPVNAGYGPSGDPRAVPYCARG